MDLLPIPIDDFLPVTFFENIPWTESYWRRCALNFADPRSLIATTSRSFRPDSIIALKANLPILPNPLIATYVAMLSPL